MVNNHKGGLTLFGPLANRTYRACLVATGRCKPVTMRSLVCRLTDYAIQVDMLAFKFNKLKKYLISHKKADN